MWALFAPAGRASWYGIQAAGSAYNRGASKTPRGGACPPLDFSPISEGTIMMVRSRFASWLSLAVVALTAIGAGIAMESSALAAAKKLNSIEGITEYRL